MKRTDEKPKFDMDDPFIAFTVTRPHMTVVISNDEQGRKDPVQHRIFEEWCDYLEYSGRLKKLRAWRAMRRGSSKFITLPCADPVDFDANYGPARRERQRMDRELREVVR